MAVAQYERCIQKMKTLTQSDNEIEKLLTHESTEYENLFFLSLCRGLRYRGMSIEVQKNVVFYHSGSIRRPDIYIPSLRLAIEVDGRSHDDKIVVIRSDQKRDPFFAALGITVLSINAHWVGNAYKRTRTLNEVFREIQRTRLDPAAARLTHRKVHYGRVMLAKHKPLIKAGLGEKVGIFDGNDYSTEFVGYRWYCGARVIIRASKARCDRIGHQ